MRRRPSSGQIVTPFSHDRHWSLIYEYKTRENVFKRRIPEIVSEPPPSWLKPTRENMAAPKTATRAPGFSRICACRACPRDTVCARCLKIGVPLCRLKNAFKKRTRVDSASSLQRALCVKNPLIFYRLPYYCHPLLLSLRYCTNRLFWTRCESIFFGFQRIERWQIWRLRNIG